MAKHILEEAARCLRCKRPQCSKGCPVGTPINVAIRLLQANKLQDAGALLFENNPLSVVCSLICPHENFCEGHCVQGKKSTPVQWSEIEHYISSQFLDRLLASPFKPEEQKGRIAIVGSGPAGLTVALILAIHGYRITIFESKDQLGGVLRYGIPEFRLPKTILDKLGKALSALGAKVRPNMLIGPVVSLEDLLKDGYKAVFIGTGVWNPKPLRLPGETMGHVHFAINYLKNPDVCELGYRVAVIGSGNVAMDVARTALRKGSEVTVLYHRGEGDMSATRYEYDYAKLEGVNFEFFTAPVRITDDGVVCESTRKVELEDGTTKLERIPGSERLFKADTVMIATGQAPRANLSGLEIGKTGLVITDEVGRTNNPAIFASGDVVTGAKTVVEAVAHSKLSAEAIMEFVESQTA